jgi:hypothetical protein
MILYAPPAHFNEVQAGRSSSQKGFHCYSSVAVHISILSNAGSCFRAIKCRMEKRARSSPEWGSSRRRDARCFPSPSRRRTRGPSRSTRSTPPRRPLREKRTIKHLPSLGRNLTAGAHAGVPDEAWRWTAHGDEGASAMVHAARARAVHVVASAGRACPPLSVSVSTRPDPRGNPWLRRWEAGRTASFPILARDQSLPTDHTTHPANER